MSGICFAGLGSTFWPGASDSSPVGLQDMDPMGEAFQQGTCEALGAKNLGPFLKGQVGGNHEAIVLVGPADHIKEQFSPCLGEREASQFIQYQQV